MTKPTAPGLDTAAVATAAGILSRSRSALFVTGAGMSADSGLPTYRGVGGLYDSGTTEEGLPIEVLLSGPLFARRPEWTWKYLAEIERACRGAAPNRGHEVLALLERRLPRCVVSCTACSWRERVVDFSRLAIPPRCPLCGGIVRPEVVLFGEMLPAAALDRLDRELAQGFDAVFTIGTTSVFPYIAGPVEAARRRGIPTVEINPGESEVSGLVDVRIRTGAREALAAIWETLEA